MHHLVWDLPAEGPAPILPGVPALLVPLLGGRGIDTPERLARYLDPAGASASDFAPLPDVELAAERILRAVRQGERILVYGDFDADGITSSAVLSEGLRRLGGDVEVYLPHRLREGHGLRAEVVKRYCTDGVGLIIASDCGTTSEAEVGAALRLGVDTVVVDHHVPPDRPHPAFALVNAHRGGADPRGRELASVGVAYRVVEAVAAAAGRTVDEGGDLLDLVALGTVADVVPLVAQNRALVTRGLQVLNRSTRPGVRALIAGAGLEPGRVDAEGIAFGLAPRINAAGRLGDALVAYRALTATDEAEATALVAELDGLNRQRRELSGRIVAEVQARVAEEGEPGPLVLVGSEAFPAGVVGLAAGKLTEQFNRPSIVMEIGPEFARGSCRSIPELNIVDALHACAELFEAYGGHAQAAGFTIRTERLAELRARLLSHAGAVLAGAVLRPRVVIDAVSPLGEVNGEPIRFLRRMEPTGERNRAPVFLSRGVQVTDARTMGADGRHLRLTLRAAGVTWEAVAFDRGPLAPPARDARIDAVYVLATDGRRGEPRLRLDLRDFRPTAT